MSASDSRRKQNRKKRANSVALVALTLCFCIVLGFGAAGYAQADPSQTAQPGQEYTVIDEPDTPLAVVETDGIWSVLNLVLAGAGGVMAVIMLSMGLFTGRGGAREPDEMQMPGQARGMNAEKTRRKISLPWMVAGILMGTSAIVVFMLTQNIDEKMVLADRWTPLMAAVILIQLIFGLMAFRKRDAGRDAHGRQFARL